MRRVLERGGRLVITDWCDDYLTCRVFDAWLRLVDPAHYRTYGQRACEALLEASRFEAIKVRRYKISWLWGLMTVKAGKGSETP
jgi:hypothetical protein